MKHRNSQIISLIYYFTLCNISFAETYSALDSIDTTIDTVEFTINEIMVDIEGLEKSISEIRSLLNSKSNNLVIEEKLNLINYSISEVKKSQVAQIELLNDNIKEIKILINTNVSNLQKIELLTSNIEKKGVVVDSIITNANLQIQKIDDRIKKLNTDSKKQYQTLGKTISKHTLYWIIAILSVLIFVLIIFFFLKSKVSEQRDSLSSVKSTQEELDSEAIRLNEQIINLIENQLSVLDLQPQSTKKVDHSLPIKLGEEIHRMRKRLDTIEESQITKVLNKRIESLEEKLNDMGYEVINLEGKIFNDGMTIQAQFVPDENLNEGESIINRVIKPQINYKGKLIQAAEVQVNQGIKM